MCRTRDALNIFQSKKAKLYPLGFKIVKHYFQDEYIHVCLGLIGCVFLLLVRDINTLKGCSSGPDKDEFKLKISLADGHISLFVLSCVPIRRLLIRRLVETTSD